jgi:hypothetical protein
MVGDKPIKSLSLTDAGEWRRLFQLGEGKAQGVEQLLASVAWVFVAMSYRRNMINEIAVTWERNGTEVETPPLVFDTQNTLPRIDESLELRAQAYLLKQRQNGAFLGLRWLDPAAVKPIKQSLTVDGYQTYWYQSKNGRVAVPAEDLIRFMISGQREHDPAPSASTASSLASQILLGMDSTADTFYDTNGLPVVAVVVPDGTSQPVLEQTQSQFKRIFSRFRSSDGNKTIGLREGTDIKTISFAPKDLAMADLEKSKIRAVLLAHGVPPSVVTEDVNRAEAGFKMLQFVNTMSGRLELIANTINADPDIMRAGVELVVHKERHDVVQTAELEKAQAIAELVGGPVLTVNEARERLELEPIAGHDVITPPAPTQAEPSQGEPMPEAEKAAELRRLKTFIDNGTHLKRPFLSDILTSKEIHKTMAEVGAAHDAPFLEWTQYP